MDLTQRKKQILQAVVQDYIRTAEPVGSANIIRRYLPEVSSATVRNDMASLEQAGLLFQPHTSAGRVPTESAYRRYVDELMVPYRLAAEERIFLQNILRNGASRVDSLVTELTEGLARFSGYTVLAMMPRMSKCRIKRMELVRLDNHNLVFILFADGDLVKHSHIKLDLPVGQELCERVSRMLNREFANLRVEELDQQRFVRLLVQFMDNPELMATLLRLVVQALADMTDVEVRLFGASNLFDYPEYGDVYRAKRMLDVLQDKETMRELLPRLITGEEACAVIGSEIGEELLQDCSLIVAPYLPQRVQAGLLAMVGPMRMEYGRSMAALDYVVKHLARLFSTDAYAEDHQLIVRNSILWRNRKDWRITHE